MVVGMRARTMHSTFGKRGSSVGAFTGAAWCRRSMGFCEACGCWRPGVRLPGVVGGVKEGERIEIGRAGVLIPSLSYWCLLDVAEALFSLLTASLLVVDAGNEFSWVK